MIRLRRHVHRSTPAIAALAILFAIGCEHEPALTTPEPPETPSRPVADMITLDEPSPPPPPGRFSGTLGSGNSMTGFGPVVLGEIPARTWVEVQISGIMNLFHAYPPELEGQPAGQVDPAGVHHGDSATCWAAIQVRSLEGAFVRHCDFYNNDPLQETWTASVPMKGEVHARRFRGPHKGALRCDYPIEIPCYTLQGIQTVTITPSADELEVRADTNNIAPGTPVTFTASTRDGSPFTVQEWIWAEVSSPSDTTGPYHTVCSTGQTCTYAPARSGTMYVRAEVNDWIEQARVGVTVVPPALIVECTPNPVVRGGTIQCSASTYPPDADLLVQEWRFLSHQNFAANASGATSWGGEMAVGGELQVLASVDGQSMETTISVEVSPRPWTNPVPPVEVQWVACLPTTEDCKLPYLPRVDAELGRTFVRPQADQFDLASLARSIDDRGPNYGVKYVAGDAPPVVFTAIIIQLHEALEDPNHPFFLEQSAAHSSDPSRYCSMDVLRQFAIDHEYAYHANLFSQRWPSIGPNPRLEATTGSMFASLEEFRIQLGAEVEDLDDLVAYAVNASDRDPEGPGLGCALSFPNGGQ